MVKVHPLVSFTGFPGGQRRDFFVGDPADVPEDYAALLMRKGLVEKPPEPPVVVDSLVFSEEPDED